jgi:hypothetical protein
MSSSSLSGATAAFVPRPTGTWTVETDPEEMPNMVFSLTFSVLPRDVGFILGSKAFKIKHINAESGAHADLKQPMTPDGLPFFFIQSFDPRAVQTCYAMIQQEAVKAEALNTGKMPRYMKSSPKTQTETPKEVVSKTIQFNESDAGLIIGKRGATIRELKQKFNLHSAQISEGILTISGTAGTADLDGAEKYLKQTFPKCFNYTCADEDEDEDEGETMTMDEYRLKKSMEWPKPSTPPPPPEPGAFTNQTQIQKKSDKDHATTAYKF